ncbi:RNA-dependent RNA polymerase [Erysiphe necator associated fusarivirus 3]|uniref:RNA-dependent RNA polymerase n=1 Tax=Erysiphe necator associated fusarivirus 3 TaxID=2743151 RepID=A0A8E3Z0T8_9VIRU|nr:RNA-dependent RNA polymerase [Erysiphe necator associated fusarivirus 3]
MCFCVCSDEAFMGETGSPVSKMFSSVIYLYRALLVLVFLVFAMSTLVFLWSGLGVALWLMVALLTAGNSLWFLPIIVFGPLGIFFATYVVSGNIVDEANNIRLHGKKRALWNSTSFSPRNPSVYFVRYAIWEGHDKTGEWLSSALKVFSLPHELQDAIGDGIASTGSYLWSEMVLSLEKVVEGPQSILISAGAFIFLLRWVPIGIWKSFRRVYMFQFLIFMLLWHLKLEHVQVLFFNFVKLFVFLSKHFNEEDIGLFFEWASWRLTSVATSIAAWATALNSEVAKYHSKSISGGSSKLMSHFKNFTMQGALFISDLGLPSFVRRRFNPEVTKRALEESLSIMKELGWPVNVSITEPEKVEGFNLSLFKEWVLCGSDLKTGIHNCKTYVDKDLLHIKSALVYRRTEEYATELNEVKATSRYFKSPDYDFPELELSDVWAVVGDIFRQSKLTSFNYIISKWEKKYALGAFMRDPSRPWSKYSRKKFITYLGGYAPFKKLWASTFYYATQILPVSAVSVKGEALPEKKWLNDKVRTVVGSPITQYILSTIWNYGPNHRFAWESTPIKIGMPLNGYWMTSVWARHARCQVHVQGDFSEFDSTISGKVIEMIKTVRKKGFEFHRDRERIAELIDANYFQVSNQLLNTTSNGNVYKKGTGLTTGHSSTSMDNSLACVILYLMAWKDITGLSAKEFVHFNELSCFGDDHVLSFLATKPAIWTPTNIYKTMLRWGLTNNLEVMKLEDIEFLSKKGRKATVPEVSWLKSLGLDNVRFLVWHNKEKLLGKLTSKVKNIQPSYRVIRLMSYLSLTAHHQDVYDGIVYAITSSRAMMAMVKANGLVIPSYEKVVRDWYNPTAPPDLKGDLIEEDENFLRGQHIVEYGSTNAIDSIVGALSMLPDLLSPVLFNYGYAKALQVFLLPRLSWVVDFMSSANKTSAVGALQYQLSKTPYRWVEVPLFVPGASFANKSSLLARHWVYMLYMSWRPTMKTGAFLNMVINRIGILQFVINGKLFNEQKDAVFSLDQVLVCALLSFIDIPDWFAALDVLLLPDLQLGVDLLTHFLLVTVWASVPPNFRELTQSLRSISGTDGHLAVSAPTATGKSTAMVQHIHNTIGHKYRKIIVIEPRSALVIGLTEYMSDNFGLSCSGSTSGLTLDKSKKVYYMTAQSLMAHSELLEPTNFFVLDEAHIDEDFYVLTRSLLTKLKLPRLFVSATLTESIKKQAWRVVDIPMASIWSVSSLHESLDLSKVKPGTVGDILISQAVQTANALGANEKAIFFLPMKSHCDRAVEMCRKPSGAIHSGVGVPKVFDRAVYFVTDIVDVGITIPGLTYVWTSSVAKMHLGFYKITDAQIGQRRGRTGRTNNGVFKLVNVVLDYSAPSAANTIDKTHMRNMLMDSLPIEIAAVFDKSLLLSALGMDTVNLDDEQENAVLRGASVFFKNFAPVFRGFVASQESANDAFGPPVVIQTTGAGHLSTSALQPTRKSREDIMKLACDVIEAGVLGQNFDQSNQYLDSLQHIAGPIYKVKNLVNSLVNDLMEGTTDLLNPKNRDHVANASDVYEFGKILRILNSI